MSLEGKTFSRRDLIKKGARLGVSAAILPELSFAQKRTPNNLAQFSLNQITPEGKIKEFLGSVPEPLINIFSTSPENMKNNPKSIKAMTFVEGDFKTVMAAFSLLDDNSIIKTTLDRNTGEYLSPETKPAPPLANCLSIAALPSNEPRIGKEVIIAGGYDFANPSTPIAALAVSKDGGESFTPKQLAQNPSVIAQIKHIPHTDKFFLRLNNLNQSRFTYGIYDLGSDVFSPVGGDYETAPVINEIYTSANKNALFGSGIVQVYSLDQNNETTILPLGLNDFEINLTSVEMARSQTHHQRKIPIGDFVLNDLAVNRDKNGVPITEYELRSQLDHHGKIVDRKIYQIDLTKEYPKNQASFHDLGHYLDMSIANKTGDSAICVPFQIMRSENGLWFFGGYLQRRTVYPFAAYISDENNFSYPYDEASVYAFPSVEGTLISQEPEKVKFYNPGEYGTVDGLDFGKITGVFGIMVNFEGIGNSLIETDGRNRPERKQRVYFSSQ